MIKINIFLKRMGQIKMLYFYEKIIKFHKNVFPEVKQYGTN